jgi:hypothetical protein
MVISTYGRNAHFRSESNGKRYRRTLRHTNFLQAPLVPKVLDRFIVHNVDRGGVTSRDVATPRGSFMSRVLLGNPLFFSALHLMFRFSLLRNN